MLSLGTRLGVHNVINVHIVNILFGLKVSKVLCTMLKSKSELIERRQVTAFRPKFI